MTEPLLFLRSIRFQAICLSVSGSSDGTLYMPPIYTAGGMPTAIAAADLNGDHIPDVVFYDSASSAVDVMLAASDLSLRVPVQYPLQNAGGHTPAQSAGHR